MTCKGQADRDPRESKNTAESTTVWDARTQNAIFEIALPNQIRKAKKEPPAKIPSYIREASNHEKLKKYGIQTATYSYLMDIQEETNPGCLVLSDAYSNLIEEKLCKTHQFTNISTSLRTYTKFQNCIIPLNNTTVLRAKMRVLWLVFCR